VDAAVEWVRVGLPAAPALLLELIQRLAVLADAAAVRGEAEGRIG
jgi:hypothetical protein